MEPSEALYTLCRRIYELAEEQRGALATRDGLLRGLWDHEAKLDGYVKVALQVNNSRLSFQEKQVQLRRLGLQLHRFYEEDQQG